MTDTLLQSRTFLLQDGALQLRHCSRCDRWYAAWLRFCSSCCAPELPLRPSQGTGELLSWVTYQRQYALPYELPVPYVVGLVELDEGVRVNGLMAAKLDPAALARGMRVQLEQPATDRPSFTTSGGEK